MISTFYVHEGFYLSKDITEKDPSGAYSKKLASAIDFAISDTSKQSLIMVLPETTANISGLDQKITGLLKANQRLLTVTADTDTLNTLRSKSSGVLNLSVADLPVMLVITSTGPVIYKDKTAMSSLLMNLTI